MVKKSPRGIEKKLDKGEIKNGSVWRRSIDFGCNVIWLKEKQFQAISPISRQAIKADNSYFLIEIDFVWNV